MKPHLISRIATGTIKFPTAPDAVRRRRAENALETELRCHGLRVMFGPKNTHSLIFRDGSGIAGPIVTLCQIALEHIGKGDHTNEAQHDGSGGVGGHKICGRQQPRRG